MDLNSARSLITSAAATNGLSISVEDADKAAAELAASVTFDKAAGSYIPVDGGHRRYRIVDGRAEDLPLIDYVLGLTRQHGRPAEHEPAASTASTKSSSAPQSGIAALRAGLAANRQAAAEKQSAEVAQAGNPWLPGRENRTAQAVITRNNPELARKYKSEAGINDTKYNWKA